MPKSIVGALCEYDTGTRRSSFDVVGPAPVSHASASFNNDKNKKTKKTQCQQAAATFSYSKKKSSFVDTSVSVKKNPFSASFSAGHTRRHCGAANGSIAGRPGGVLSPGSVPTWQRDHLIFQAFLR